MKYISAALTAVATLAMAQPAAASVYSDDLGKCLVAKTSDQDKIALVQWIFVAISASNTVKDMASITPQRREVHIRAVAALFDRLLEVDCRSETIAAVKYDGADAIKISFGLLGQVATKLLMTDPAVDSSVGEFTKYIDAGKLAAVLAEGGLRAPPATKDSTTPPK
jgi:hypothetical protein